MASAAQIIMITGSMAAGKSSVAQALAERLPHSVHLRGDAFRRMIVGGQACMELELSPEAQGQLWLRYRIAAAAAALYAAAGFTVVYQDIIIGPELGRVLELYRAHSLALVVLCPRAEVLAARDAGRHKTGYHDAAAARAFDHALRTQTPRLGYWLDNSDLTVAATAEHILAHLPDAAVTWPLRPGEG